MKKLALLAAGLFALTGISHAQNLLTAPGFEGLAPGLLTPKPGVFGTIQTGQWYTFQGGGAITLAVGSTSPRTGSQDFELAVSAADNTFLGVMQRFSATAGQSYSFSGFHRVIGNVLDAVVEVRFEWYDNNGTEVIGRTNINPVPNASTYDTFNRTFIAPAGATTGFAVYLLQTYASPIVPGPVANSGSVVVDDFLLTGPVPEPATAALAGIGGLSLLMRRRRKA